MKNFIVFLLIFLVSCVKFESERLYTQEELDIINEKTDGVIVYLYAQNAYIVNDLGQNNIKIPNTVSSVDFKI